MTVGIDIRVLARGTRSGIEEYTLNLLSYLLPLDQNIIYKLFYNAYRKADLEFGWLALPNVKLAGFNIPNRLFDIASRYGNFPKVDKLLGGVDVFFSPHIFLAALSAGCPSVVTFHDLSFERYKEFYSLQKRYWHFSMNPRFQAARAGKIIAVSESTKQDLVELYKIPSDKIKLIYSGIDQESKIKNQESRIAEIRRKYKLPDKYILYLGTIEPRKNIIGLIKAYESFRSKLIVHDFKFVIPKLVIAGAKGWLYQDVFRAFVHSPRKNDIIFTGFVDNQDKEFVYRSADLFVYPSFFEGFGFPPLEAMAQGVPAITSNNASLSEAIGDAALMVDPYNIDEMAWAIKELTMDGKLRDKMIGRGREQAKKFSWRKCAAETLEVLRSAQQATKKESENNPLSG